jgi:diguanylate cyclase (GGDEF)-like protein
MKNSESQNDLALKKTKFTSNYLSYGVFVLALGIIFVVSNSDLSFAIKLIVLAAMVIASGFHEWRYFKKRDRLNVQAVDNKTIELKAIEVSDTTAVFDDDIENKLFALEEASQFFGASLKAGDMFRLLSARINEMIPFESCALFQGDAESQSLKIVFSAGKNAANLANLEIKSSIGLAGKTFTTRKCQLDKQNLMDSGLFGQEFSAEAVSTIAAPLFRDTEIFGVLQLFGKQEFRYGESSLKLLEAISERFSPLILSSIAFENNLSNALTDSLTNLPNERAFFLVLENQFAESQRSRDERPLSVLAIDIKNFSEINQTFGHSTGDGILSFAAVIIKNQLRGMDFLARSSSDEFLTVLPTASEETTLEIVARLEAVFQTSPFGLEAGNRIMIQLNYGAATFWKDGETPAELLRTAQVRKLQGKTPGSMKILPFPSGK